jgi:hypothetical protein
VWGVWRLSQSISGGSTAFGLWRDPSAGKRLLRPHFTGPPGPVPEQDLRMPGIAVLPSFTVAARGPEPRTFETVVAVTHSAIDDVLGSKSLSERKDILRRMASDGFLVTGSEDRLSVKVPAGPDPYPSKPIRSYVFDTPNPRDVRVVADRIRKEAAPAPAPGGGGKILRSRRPSVNQPYPLA